VLRWAPESLLDLPCAQIGEHYGRYRLHQPEAERAMARSLDRYGQLSPVVVCQREGHYELIDGFKRLGAARGLASLSHLSARVMEADERAAKAAIYGLNRAGGRTRELEEAWIVHALVREDGLSQVEVAELLGRHKSWVCRRLALLERLGPESREELRVTVKVLSEQNLVSSEARAKAEVRAAELATQLGVTQAVVISRP